MSLREDGSETNFRLVHDDSVRERKLRGCESREFMGEEGVAAERT
jgi:hypothetical protein